MFLIDYMLRKKKNIKEKNYINIYLVYGNKYGFQQLLHMNSQTDNISTIK